VPVAIALIVVERRAAGGSNGVRATVG
jgi:hypothetical protein